MSQLAQEYRKVRERYSTMRAAQALVHARAQTGRPEDWNLGLRYTDDSVQLERDGFKVTVSTEADPYGELDYYGEFSDRWQPGAIARPNPGRNEFRYFVPMNSYNEHYTSLRRDHSRADADLVRGSK